MLRCCGVVLLLASVGCRERNPEWLGPVTEAVSTSTGSTQASGTSSGSSTSAGGSSATGEPTPCNNENQCPEGLLCGPVFCQSGVEGDDCTRSQHCADPFFCSSGRVCQDGSPGDPCNGPDDCAAESTCENEVCA